MIGCRKPRLWQAALLLCLAVAAGARAEPPKQLATGEMANFVFLKAPQPTPEVSFVDGENRPLGLERFRGKVLLINFWATWCAPCRKEMKELDDLQRQLGGAKFEVLAISADRQGPSVIDAFYDEVGIKHLAKYNDASMKTHRAFKSLGLPTTVLLDHQGQEIGRLVGPAIWNAKEALALVGHYVAAVP
ncbi:MAG: TlpA family protein disulfide reductase [Alphaproteobacteria bacterium]|nr:TlpA family protein disulfide reductase [Alphaproteobacteria bacterium]